MKNKESGVTDLELVHLINKGAKLSDRARYQERLNFKLRSRIRKRGVIVAAIQAGDTMPLSATSIFTAGTDDRVALGISGNHQEVRDMLHEASIGFRFQAS